MIKPGTLVMATRTFEEWSYREMGGVPVKGSTALVIGESATHPGRCYDLLHFDGRRQSWWRGWFWEEKDFEAKNGCRQGRPPVWKIVKEP